MCAYIYVVKEFEEIKVHAHAIVKELAPYADVTKGIVGSYNKRDNLPDSADRMANDKAEGIKEVEL